MREMAKRARDIHGLHATAEVLMQAARVLDEARDDLDIAQAERDNISEHNEYLVILLQQANDAVTVSQESITNLRAGLDEIYDTVERVNPRPCDECYDREQGF